METVFFQRRTKFISDKTHSDIQVYYKNKKKATNYQLFINKSITLLSFAPNTNKRILGYRLYELVGYMDIL